MSSANSGLRVLLAEDSKVVQRLARGMLEQKGHSVTVVASGRQAVEQAEREPYDLILMDLQMPEMDGLDACQAIRQAERQTGGHIPIIALTGSESEQDRERCRAAGMDDYISKPIRAHELFQKIDRLLAAVQPEASASASSASRPPPASDSTAIDWNTALESLGGKRKLLREIIDLYHLEGPRLLQQIQRALDSNDVESLRIAAHTLKGSSRYFGENRVAQLAGEMERLASEEDLEATRTYFEPLATALAGLLPALNRFDPEALD